jgi:hypothetical protein
MRTQAKVRLFTQPQRQTDADTSDGFSFSLADESLGFSIDAIYGCCLPLMLTLTADYENAQSQSFTVVATDAAG